MTCRRAYAGAAALAVLLLAACGGGSVPDADGALPTFLKRNTATPSTGASGGASGTATPRPGTTVAPTAPGATAPGGAGSTAPTAPGGTASSGPGGSASAYPPPPTLSPVDVTVEPLCVRPGSTVTMEVRRAPADAAAVYQAVYNGERSGAPPPFGHGYGGNAGGRTDGNGRWRTTWTVTANAPEGPARVEVTVAGEGGGFHHGKAGFTVGDPVTGRCD